jgi:FkbM family methyltransferase
MCTNGSLISKDLLENNTYFISMSAYPTITLRTYTIEPQELFQTDIEINGQQIICDKEKIKDVGCTIVIVGAWRGEEIVSFLKWEKSTIFAFEPNPENFAYLKDVYTQSSRVTCFDVACSNTDGQAELFQANLTGNDSLLPIQERAGFEHVSSHIVKTMKLDSVEELHNRDVDLLWIDVQGFEKYVLLGAPTVLKRTSALFLELNDNDNAYKGATRIAELVELLDAAGFYMVHQEISVQTETGIKSGMGFFMRKEKQINFFTQDNIDKRVSVLTQSITKKIKIHQGFLYKLAVRILPVAVKKYIKSLIVSLKS